MSARVGTRDCPNLKKSGDCKTVKVGTQSDPDHLVVLFRKCLGGPIIEMEVSDMSEIPVSAFTHTRSYCTAQRSVSRRIIIKFLQKIHIVVSQAIEAQKFGRYVYVFHHWKISLG